MEISKIRQKIYNLQQSRKKIEDDLLRTKQVLAGSLSYVYNVCGNPNCKCKKGERHGPYPLLSLNIKGKKTTRFVKKKEIEKITKRLQEYRRFRQNIKKLKDVNKKINEYFDKIKNLQSK